MEIARPRLGIKQLLLILFHQVKGTSSMVSLLCPGSLHTADMSLLKLQVKNCDSLTQNLPLTFSLHLPHTHPWYTPQAGLELSHPASASWMLWLQVCISPLNYPVIFFFFYSWRWKLECMGYRGLGRAANKISALEFTVPDLSVPMLTPSPRTSLVFQLSCPSPCVYTCPEA